MRRAAVVKQKGAAATPKRVKGATVAPDYLLRLMEHVGPSEAARLLGTTASTLHKGRRMMEVTPAFEIAARGIWQEQGYEEEAQAMAEEPPRAAPPRTTDMHQAVGSAQAAGMVLFLIQVPRERAQMLQRSAEMLGATVVSHD